MEAFYQKLVKELALDEEQQKAVKAAIDTFVQAEKNWQSEHGEELKALMTQIREVGREDREKARELRTKQQELMKGRAQLRQTLNKQIADVLKEEQKTKFAAILRAEAQPDPIATLRAALPKLGLSEEVLKKANDVLAKAETDAKSARARAKADVVRKAVGDVKALLTDEQKAQLEKMLAARQQPQNARLPGALGQLKDLTAEQQEQIAKAMAAVQQAEPDKRQEARREAMQKILTEILTPAQREQIQKARGGGQDRPRNRNRPGNAEGAAE